MEEQIECIVPTFGETLVGITFSPDNNLKVQRVKEICAELADIARDEDARNPYGKWGLHTTIQQHAFCEILNAQMSVVKLIKLDKY